MANNPDNKNTPALTSSKTSVMSPSDSREGLTKNAGGMPATWSVDKIFSEATPPNYPAKGSVTTAGSPGGGMA